MTETTEDGSRRTKGGVFTRDVTANVIANLIANWLTIGGVYVLGVWRHWWPQHNDVLWVVATLTVVATLLGASISLVRWVLEVLA